jgi:phage terminase large subunit-like protein
MGRFQEHIIKDLAPYQVWRDEGLLTVTGGVAEYKNDFKYIIKELGQAVTENNLLLQGIGYDPHNADGFLSDLEPFGVPLMMVKQSARELDAATQHFQLEVKSGRVSYDRKNGLLSWSMINAKTTHNSFGETKVDKEGKRNRIDPVDAVLDAVTMMQKLSGTEPLDRDKALEDYMKAMGWL